MKEKITEEQINKPREKIIKKCKFKYEIPICFDDLELGNLKIYFDLNREQVCPINVDKKRKLLVSYLEDELVNYSHFIKKKIEYELGLRSKFSDPIEEAFRTIMRGAIPLMMLMPSSGIGKINKSQLGNFLYTKENEIFKLIKSDGPIILCHAIVQEKIIEWLSNKNIASPQMNKLKNSLLEYSFGVSAKKKIFKVGRPGIDSIKQLKKTEIKFFYKLLTFLFRKIKKNKEIYKRNTIKEIIEHAGKNIFISLSKIFSYSDKATEKEITEGIKELDRLTSKDEEQFYPISNLIENDEDLKREFYRFKWQPNKFAKEIISRLNNVSVYAIESLLYR